MPVSGRHPGVRGLLCGFQKENIGKNEGAGAIINDMQQTKHLNDSVRLARAIQDQLILFL
jgi:hypothetical protein